MSPAADVRKSNGAGVLVYKDRDDARVADDDDASGAHTTAAKSGSETWWQWVDRRFDDNNEQIVKAVGEALGLKCADIRDQLEEGDAATRRELELLKREFTILKTRGRP